MPVDKSSALNLRLNKQLSYADIAAIQHVSPQAIHKALKPLMPGPEVRTFQDHRADILSGLQIKLLNQIDPQRLKKISVRDAVVSAAVLYDKERLERGQSTSNHAISILIERIAKERKKKVEGKDDSINV